jgi:nitrogen fixation protein FixH
MPRQLAGTTAPLARQSCGSATLIGGAQFRRLRAKLGAPIAIKAMAAKLARPVYRMWRDGMQFVDRGAKLYEAQHRNQQISCLEWKAAKPDSKSLKLWQA